MISEFPVYSKRKENILNILSHLASNKEVYQNKIPKEVNCSYRTGLRQLQVIKEFGFAKIIRKERPEKQGKARNVWQITFKGIMFALTQEPESIDEIAPVHRNVWVVLQEWESLTHDLEIKEMLLNFLSNYNILNESSYGLPESGLSLVGQNKSRKKYPEMFEVLEQILPEGVTKKETADYHKSMNKISENLNKTDATLKVLGLDLIFISKAIPPFINEENHVLIRHWKNCWKNPKIREFMIQQFNIEKQKCHDLREYEKHFKNL